MLMSYAELQFILAEAAVKGYIPGGNTEAEKYYYAGIYGSYAQFGDDLVAAVDNVGLLPMAGATSDSLAADFIANDNWGWDPANALELIGTQRWAATFDQGLQSFIEWRRSGYPVLTPAEDGSNSGKIPVRYPYPTDEAARNPTSLQAGIGLLGGADDLNTRVGGMLTKQRSSNSLTTFKTNRMKSKINVFILIFTLLGLLFTACNKSEDLVTPNAKTGGLVSPTASVPYKLGIPQRLTCRLLFPRDPYCHS
jgi:hypothetical protein